MADDHGAATVASGMDMPAHEATYAQFVSMTETISAYIICIVLCLVIWGLEGYGLIALAGFIVATVGLAAGVLSGLGWKTVAPIAGLLGLAAIVL